MLQRFPYSSRLTSHLPHPRTNRIPCLTITTRCAFAPAVLDPKAFRRTRTGELRTDSVREPCNTRRHQATCEGLEGAFDVETSPFIDEGWVAFERGVRSVRDVWIFMNYKRAYGRCPLVINHWRGAVYAWITRERVRRLDLKCVIESHRRLA